MYPLFALVVDKNFPSVNGKIKITITPPLFSMLVFFLMWYFVHFFFSPAAPAYSFRNKLVFVETSLSPQCCFLPPVPEGPFRESSS